MKWYYVLLIITVSAAVGVIVGNKATKMKHDCTVDKTTGKMTCTK